jgi:hypothetical protein
MMSFPMVPHFIPKTQPFALPTGTVKEHDAGSWALYYNPQYNITYLVIDFPHQWKVNYYLGKYTVNYTTKLIAGMPCCQDR